MQPGGEQLAYDPVLFWLALGVGGYGQLEQEEEGEEGVGEGDGGHSVLGCESKGSLSSRSPNAEKLGHRVVN